MIAFRLNPDTVQRLTQQFESFDADRKKLHALLDEYVLDYRSLSGTILEKEGLLREKYLPKAPALSHLLYTEDGTLYWRLADIAIVMGRGDSSISRTLRKIERARGWRTRLYELRKPIESHENSPVYGYAKGIFDLIIDFYEEEYLHRFTKPRRGTPKNSQEKKEIYHFWGYLKARARSDTLENYVLKSPEYTLLAEAPPLTLGEIVKLIVKKVFTIKMGAFFTVLIAFSYEMSKRWSGLHLWLPVFCGALFMIVLLLMRYRRGEPNLLANAGAGILLFVLIWGSALVSEDREYRQPKEKVEISPRLSSSEYAAMVTEKIPAWGAILSGAEAFTTQLQEEAQAKQEITDEEFEAEVAQLRDSIPALLQQRDRVPFPAIQSAVRDMYIRIAEMYVARFRVTDNAQLLDSALSAYKSAESITVDPAEKTALQNKSREVSQLLNEPLLQKHAALVMDGAAFLERFHSGKTVPDKNEIDAVQQALSRGISEMFRLSVVKSARARVEIQMLKGDIYAAAYGAYRDMDALEEALQCYREAENESDLDLDDQEIKKQALQKSTDVRIKIDNALLEQLQKGVAFLERLRVESTSASIEGEDIREVENMLDGVSRRASRYSSQQSLLIYVKSEILKGDIYVAAYDLSHDMDMLEGALSCYEDVENARYADAEGEILKDQARRKSVSVRAKIENAPEELLKEGTAFLERLRSGGELPTDGNIRHIKEILEKTEQQALNDAHKQSLTVAINFLMGEICSVAYNKTGDILRLDNALSHYKSIAKMQLAEQKIKKQAAQKAEVARSRLDNLVEETTHAWVEDTENMLRSAQQGGEFSIEAMQKLAAAMDTTAEMLIHYQNASFNASFPKCYQAQAILYYNIGQLCEWQYRHHDSTETMLDSVNSYYRRALFYAQSDELKQKVRQALDAIKQ